MDHTSNLLSLFQPGDLPYALLIVVLALVTARLMRKLFEGLGRRFTDKRLLINQAGSFVRFGILLIGGLTAALTVLEITPEVLLALGGTIAVSVGFALKDFVSSIIAGLIVLIDRPFQVGDRVLLTMGDRLSNQGGTNTMRLIQVSEEGFADTQTELDLH